MSGCKVDLVLYHEGNISVVPTVIASPIPLVLLAVGDANPSLRVGHRVMLLAHHEGLAMRAEGVLDLVIDGLEGTEYEITDVQWELLERRRHIRVPVSVSVSMQTVRRTKDEFVKTYTGTTFDMSLSGAFIHANELPEENALVEVTIELEPNKVKTLAVVARVHKEGIGAGLHFVQYLNDSQPLLEEFLFDAA